MSPTAKHILELSKEKRQKFLDSFDFVLSDCDGVIWKFSGPMEGAKEGLEVLRSNNKRLAYVSNNSFLSRQKYEEHFADLGITFDYNKDLVHPAAATVAYLKKLQFQGIVYVIGSDPFKAVLEEAGFQCISMPSTTEVASLKDIMTMVYKSPKVSAVVYDVDLNLNLTKFYAAQYFLASSPECLLIYGASDKTFKYDNQVYAGVGVFMEALANQAQQAPVILGKPSQELGDLVVDKFQIKDRSRVLFIGDTLKQDIGFANTCGYQSLLVLSGATSKEMFQNNKVAGELPDYYADSLFDFVAFMAKGEE